ncbi:DUF6541 family protein [Arsenicicoccus sp. oral taxon 190]|uniref:DUF6541 family protein n=1 Tax=Arsenicicoccus sp. oral taxon 190 TaxID=1658671 RepID=UPI00067A161A|nr:DUF6541 family protein [Arsenicicoccus sp. oral taxon 190]AKT52388.1 hypothetical protein ADJ73_15920 [Arsenicicoccus sp. oral taxon 190]
MTWVPVLPALGLVALLLVGPGWLAAQAAGLRGERALGMAPALSVTAIAMAIVVQSRLHLRWGLTPVLLGSALVLLCGAAVGLAGWAVNRRRAARRDRSSSEISGATAAGDGDEAARVASPWWGILPTWPFLLACVVWCGWTAAILVYAIGDVSSVPQNFDAVFHLNAIQRVVELRDSAPTVIAATSNSTSSLSFYPPLFHGVASLAVLATGVPIEVAANVTAVAIGAVAWPLSAMFLVRSVVGWSRSSALLIAVLAPTLALFPYLLLSFGVLWPNALGLAAAPAAVVLVAVTLRLVRISGLGPWRALLLGLLVSVGLAYAHPGSVFAVLALAIPMLAVVVGAQVARWWRAGGRYRYASVGLALGVVLLVKLGWPSVLDTPLLSVVPEFNWDRVETLEQAMGESLALASSRSPAGWLLAVFVVLGVVEAIRRRQHVWLVVAHGCVVYLYMQAAGSDDQLSSDLTRFWYNDRFRVAAILAMTALPLAALGAEAVRRAVASWVAGGPARWVGGARRHTVLATLLVGLAVVALTPGRWMPTGPYQTIVDSYSPTNPDEWLLDRYERQLYERTLRPSHPGDDRKVAGNPWNGAALAGPVSGRPSLFGHLINISDPDHTLLRKRFNTLDHDPAVCAAIRRLGVGFATEDTKYFQPWDKRIVDYSGLTGFGQVKGLTLIAREGTTSVYAVTGCRAG